MTIPHRPLDCVDVVTLLGGSYPTPFSLRDPEVYNLADISIEESLGLLDTEGKSLMRSLLLDDVLMDYVGDPQNWTWYDDRGWFRNTYGPWGGVAPMLIPEELLSRVRAVTCTIYAWTAASSQYLAYQYLTVKNSKDISVTMGSGAPGHTVATLHIYHGDNGMSTHYSSQLGIPARVDIPEGEVCTGMYIGSGGFYDGTYYNILSRGLKDITLHF